MMEQDKVYQTPLVERYASPEMLYLFSSHFKFVTWRKLWLALAEIEKELGLPITSEQIDAMRRVLEKVDLERARKKEEEVRHDVMAHILLFAEDAPAARPIIHLGATSAFVTDNTELIQMKKGLELLLARLVNVIDILATFAEEHKNLPTLGYTHFQPAQLVTVGKRASLWLQDLLLDLEEVEFRLSKLRFGGTKGATGTQASFLALFNNDPQKVRELDRLLAMRMGFEATFPVTGQTYSRKQDAFILSTLAGVAQSAHKFANDLRLLSHLKEVEEPLAPGQVGSSAMPYKRNPVRSERMTGLARYVIVNALNPALTAAEQWLERTLDDSSNRRISLPEAFLAADAILLLYHSIARAMTVNPILIAKHLLEELPFIASEVILMEAVKAGGDRQTLHERIRLHSLEASKRIRSGMPNNLLALLVADPAFSAVKGRIASLADPARLTGMSAIQVEEFLKEYVAPVRRRYSQLLGPDMTGEVPV